MTVFTPSRRNVKRGAGEKKGKKIAEKELFSI